MIIAIIPARIGSKRIKYKNIKKFQKKPIIYWSIKVAKDSGVFDKIIVSTDSPKIAKIARKYGAETPFLRPKNLSNDYANTDKVIQHAVSWLCKKKNKLKYICCIYPTAPFLTKKVIRKGLNLLIKKKKLFTFTVTPFQHPIERALKINKNLEVTPISKNNEKKRSQKFKTLYHDIGQMYWGTYDAFLKNKKIFSHNSAVIKVPGYLAHDINTIDEWKKAELVYTILKKQKKL